jgi:hypothetical protein
MAHLKTTEEKLEKDLSSFREARELKAIQGTLKIVFDNPRRFIDIDA